MTPVVNEVALAPEIVKVAGVDAGPTTLPVKVTPPLSALLMVLLANTLIVLELEKAVVVPVILNVPPFKLMSPEAPKLASAEIANVPWVTVVPPV